MDTLRNGAAYASSVLHFIGEWPAFLGTLAMAGTIVFGVTTRYVFNYPMKFVDEWNGYFMAAAALLPLSYVLRHGGHIRLDLLVKALPPRAARPLETATLVISLALVLILLAGTMKLAWESFATDRRAYSALETPLGPVQLIMPLGLALLAVQIVADLARGKRPEEKPEK